MTKPTTHNHGAAPAYLKYFDVDEIHIGAWCPDPLALTAPTQVHMALKIHGVDDPVLCRWKGPDTLSTIIDQLIEYRNAVWPEVAQEGAVDLSPVGFEEVNAVLQASEGMPECRPLPCATDGNVVVSRWQMPEAARVLIARGASVWLTVWGRTQPPVALSVSQDGPFEAREQEGLAT